MKITPMTELIAHYGPGAGRHWFDASTLRWFKSRIPEYGYTTEDGKRTYFVTSEKGPSNIRKYTVRMYEWGIRDISSVGGFQAFGTRAMAQSNARYRAESYLLSQVV